MTENGSDLEDATRLEGDDGQYVARLMGVSGKIWDTGGSLLATGSAQLCCVPNRQ